MAVTLIIVCLLLCFSASFSSFETAVFSLTPLQRYRLKEAGGVASLIARILDRPREFLATVLLGNELVNVAIAILAGGIAYQFLIGYEVRDVYLLSTAVTTLILLIFGEIVPKNIAVRYPVLVSQVLIIPYILFSWVVFPFRAFFARIADVVVSLFGADPRKGRRLIVEEELRSFLDQGKKEGTLADLERTLIQSALDFSGQRLSRVMTPKEKIVALSVGTSWEDVLKTLEKNPFSRIPVYEGDPSQVVGILYAKDLLPFRKDAEEAKKFSLKTILRPPLVVSPDETLDRVFQEFQRHRAHMGIVKDRSSKVIGLITMDDLLRRFFP